jgi:hypothetical protein
MLHEGAAVEPFLGLNSRLTLFSVVWRDEAEPELEHLVHQGPLAQGKCLTLHLSAGR